MTSLKHQEDMRKFIVHPLRFSKESSAVSKKVQKWLWKEDWIGVFMAFIGLARMRLPENGMNFPPAPSKSTWALSSADQDVDQRKRVWNSKLSKHQKLVRLFIIPTHLC